ncbi:alpha-L-fucosidase [Fundicoccus culcitae]|uniref:alpha-L-fucosidase n=1 Tax=Fundicoccus culcitae TaxID=2969821 RepID=A0ABY5P7U9_9LACT|nr:alpha-L-fucosidase [Fundicoccus culcitae]UUX34455.1 alpha-L-fucosidase [Fundicoccus culcitae]
MNINETITIRPNARQYQWQQVEFFGFIHFGINTMNDVEWGDGSESPSVFNPSKLDCHQWVKTFKDAGMKGAILTCKHHDGFCLWPSQFTQHSVASSPWKNGVGDVVAEFSQACHDLDMKFGVYLSPWDRAESTYGQGKAYDDYFVHQIEELLTNYGDVFEVWFDGANGEGPNGKVQVYDWQRYYDTIHRLQPKAVIAISGPDVRWVGNEAGKTRDNEWSVVPIQYSNPNYTADHSQQVDDGTFPLHFDATDQDLASSERLANYTGELIWYPAEVDTSIRPGWFYHENQDEQVRSAEELFDIYKGAVGGNCALILNVPPNKEGLFAAQDIQNLQALGKKIKQLKHLRPKGDFKYYVSSNQLGLNKDTMQTQRLTDSYWQSAVADETPSITLRFEEQQAINTLILQEHILASQRVERFTIYYRKNNQKQQLLSSGTIGYQKIVEFDTLYTDEIWIEFNEFRGDTVCINTGIAGYLER